MTTDGGSIRLEPLRNFPVVADLVVDMESFFQQMQMVGMPIVGPTDPFPRQEAEDYNAFENCIECGMCLSACPVAATDGAYLGPAALAAAQRVIATGDGRLSPEVLAALDGDHGVWRCHSAFECTAVCPSNVDPAGKIMALRRHMTWQRIRGLRGLKRC
jgi:succinate dehydrogenase / fumarate reductase iron-sulfur subunit